MTAEPYTKMLEALTNFVSLDNLSNLARAEIFATDPRLDSNAQGTPLAAMTTEHFPQVVAITPAGQPAYFCRAPNGLRLVPTCDKPYWFRATYRAPIKLGPAP